MILPQSQLKLIKFDILEFHMGYVPPRESIDEIDEGKYVVDLDYNITVDKKTGHIFIYTSVVINSMEAKYPCLVLDIEAGTVFDMDPSFKMRKEVEAMVMNQSAIPIAFNNVRGFIQNITSYSPLGTYTLPLFYSSDLISSKNNKTRKIKKATSEKVVMKK